MLLCELDDSGNESILRRTVDVTATFEDRSDGEDIRGRDFGFILLDGFQNLLGSHIEPSFHIDESLSVCGPENDHSIQTILRLEIADIATDVLEILHKKQRETKENRKKYDRVSNEDTARARRRTRKTEH